jgi:3-oxoacyl-[acyl-carrier protein] reductase
MSSEGWAWVGVISGLASEALLPYSLARMNQQLANQIAVVTGAGRGIGRAIALAFAAEGADVVCISRTVENSEKVANEIRALGRKAWAYALDVADAAAVNAAAEKLLAEAGRVDILVNNAGITRDGLLMRMSDEDWDAVINTNLKGTFLLTRALSRAFIKQRSGRIINVASISGLVGNAGQCNYAASKSALLGFSKSLAREVASRGITVNVVAPGFIDTDMTAVLNEQIRTQVLKSIPMNRFGQPEDIAAAALFLASPAARYITGQVLTVDGGMVM